MDPNTIDTMVYTAIGISALGLQTSLDMIRHNQIIAMTNDLLYRKKDSVFFNEDRLSICGYFSWQARKHYDKVKSNIIDEKL